MTPWFPMAKRQSMLAFAGVAGFAASVSAETFPADQIAFFENSVRPLLAERCQSCHGVTKHQNGLRLDSRAAVLQGSDYGKVVEPGNPSASKLIKAVKHAPGVEAMPKKGDALKPEQIAALEKWITMGVPWPEEKAPAVAHAEKADWKTHWAYQPIKKPAGKESIDAVVGAKLKVAGLDFAPSAKPEHLARRLYLSLTGLPPSFEQVEEFKQAAAKNPKATAESLIDKLLASPQYGERWARIWLDVARYSDTEGYTAGGRDNRYPNAFTYRDWVVNSLNSDMPYDQFITNQLAADKLVGSIDPNGTNSPNLAALGFLTVNDSFLGDRLLQTDDRIDVVGRGLMGITIGCARCHDHKFDPLKGKDYYALYSVFNSSETSDDFQPVIGQPKDQAAIADFHAKVGDVQTKMSAFKKEIFDDMRQKDRMTDYLVFANREREVEDASFRGKAGQAKLRDRVADKWRDFLNRYAFNAKPHPVMLAWKEFAAVPEKEFAAKAPEIAKKLGAPDSPANGVVRNELAKRPAPKSFSDVIGMYSEIFLTCMDGKQPDNEDWRAVRGLLQDRMSPMSVPVEGVEAFFTRKDREHMTKFENEIKKIEMTSPGAPMRAMVMVDKPKPNDVRVYIRGNPARQGDPAPRGFPAFLGGQQFKEGSGRLELAKLVASKDNPLTARVIVNRVWMQHFGKPLVSQTSDFGVQTPKPEQAELLDYLAATFMEQGWSLKKLHRLILNSRTYQQSAETTQAKDLKDADNALLSRFTRLRLDYEQMRDSMLKVAGSLDVSQRGGRPVALTAPEATARRSLYLEVDRYEQATVPAMFDFANPDSHSPQRFVTTVPQQTLFLMNSPFMRDRAEQLTAAKEADAEKEITALYRKVLQRNPQAAELQVAKRFLAESNTSQGSPPFRWSYGTMRFTKGADGATTFSDWQPFAVLDPKHKETWSHTGIIPDKKWSYAMWRTTGGHAARDDVAPAARWTAPADDTIRVFGKLKKDSDKGNGVRGWIVSSVRGVVKDVLVKPATEEVVGLGKYEVKKGETLTFAVGSEGDTNSDSFNWIPEIHRLNADGSTEKLTNAKTDFCDKDGWPLNRPKPESPLAQLAQVLLMSNEFQFVD
ncbi:MAG: PSD1 and planctomycete cytochrome C domain-containing protein [Verrucomicrobiaceae bacterium]|nr:PSD1 and planctomycete cytochrome C domain-containing protein [Verrucomicrobiaceae bacterium]